MQDEKRITVYETDLNGNIRFLTPKQRKRARQKYNRDIARKVRADGK